MAVYTAREFSVSRKTGYKILARYNETGLGVGVVRSEGAAQFIKTSDLRAPTLNKGSLNRNGHFQRCTHPFGTAS
jgi:hypothetical protein